MTLRKITIDNSLRYVPKIEQTREIKQNTTKKKKQSEKILENVAASGLGILHWITNCYF